MTIEIDVVIPTLNAGESLARTLATLRGDHGFALSITVCDGGSHDDSQAIARQAGATVVTTQAGRGRQLATGAAACSAPWLLFLHADTVLAPGWTDAAGRFVSQAANAGKAGYFRLRPFETDGRVYALFGVHRFRYVVSNGDLAVRLMRWIDPNLARLGRPTLAQHELRRRLSEQLHWGYLLGSIPTMMWAVLVGQPWFAVYLLVGNIVFNLYPILLQRYTRAKLARICERPRMRAKEWAAEPAAAEFHRSTAHRSQHLAGSSAGS